ncbi:MAG: hypothetical protein A07HB70_02491 [uncultured archaeon A07HB70]|nr:MAG: hypothetical protein A07HB70_02491 [uncultured archaeon A07HB70]
MTETLDADLYRRTEALLEPGEVTLNGAVIHTDLGGDQDLEMHELTVDLNDVVARHSPEASAGETYIYAGNDDPEFASNQFQGRRLDDDEFVWECQQLLREGSFDLVFYYPASADHVAVVEGVEALGHRVTGVRTDGEAARDDAP